MPAQPTRSGGARRTATNSRSRRPNSSIVRRKFGESGKGVNVPAKAVRTAKATGRPLFEDGTLGKLPTRKLSPSALKATKPAPKTAPRYQKPTLKGPTKIEGRRITSGPQTARQKGLGPSVSVPRKALAQAKRRSTPNGGGIDLGKFAGEVGANVNRELDRIIPGRQRGTGQIKRALDTGFDKNNPLKKILK